MPQFWMQMLRAALKWNLDSALENLKSLIFLVLRRWLMG